MSFTIETKPENFVMDGYLYMHRAIRSDMVKMEAAANKLYQRGAEYAGKLQKWFEFFWAMVEEHHTGEDDDLFPKIAKRDINFTAQLEIMERDHKEIHEMVNNIGADLGRIQNLQGEAYEAACRQLAALVTRFRLTMSDHLDREESLVVPSIANHFPVAEQQAMEKEVTKRMPRKFMTMAFPWIASSMTDEEVATIMKTFPLIIQLLFKYSWKKKYAKFTAVFREN